MILAISRFKVANGMEEEVAEAFRRRPRLVDDEPGFLGMEVFTERQDPRVFHLVTRWTDVESYTSWHGSERHDRSHRGIPKGLKLDGRFTKILVLDRIEDPTLIEGSEARAPEEVPVVRSFLERSDNVYIARGTADGTLQAVNGAFAGAVGCTVEEMVGTPLWSYLVADDQELLRDTIQDCRSAPQERMLLHFSDLNHRPFTLACRLGADGDSFLLIGEDPAEDRGLSSAFLEANNELAVLARENARRNRELEATRARLEATLEELDQSYWHLRKLQEVLPICMDCGKVKGAEAKWESIVDYLKSNALFLSHGYCPDCEERLVGSI